MASHRDPKPTPTELADECWVLSLLHEVQQEVRAPRRLRLRVEAEIRSVRGPVPGLPRPVLPQLSSTLGWQATGQRRDLLDDHPAVTVYYAAAERRLAYTIVSGAALAQPAARTTVTHGMTLRTLRMRGHLIVTWRRDGRTCVLTGTKVSAAQLRELAVTTRRPTTD
jgi:hypothetical protein